MARIGSMMAIGQQAMANSQNALQTTAHNISNSNTEGYSRQRVDQKTNPPVGEGNLRLGQGARTTAVERISSDFLTKQIQDEMGKMGTASGRQDSLSRVESVFNESINKGLNRFLSNFFNAFREFSNSPESMATRALVKEAANQLTEDFHRIHRQLGGIQEDANFAAKSYVTQLNGYIKEIAEINDTILKVEASGRKTNDERDRRDVLVKKVGELINIHSAEGDNGMVTITAGNTAVLVSGSQFTELAARPTPGTDTKRDGDFDITYRPTKTGSEFVVSSEMTGGIIGGMLDIRDRVINEIHTKVDEMAFSLANLVNDLHRNGYDLYGRTGVDFFENLDGVHKASELIKVSSQVMKDPASIAGALQPNSPGDNRLANQIAQIESKQIFNNGTATINDLYNGMIGEFAVKVKQNEMVLDHQKNIVKSLNNIRESISGVSLDEEAADMIKFQKAFDASARVIKVADEMLDTILNIKRM